MRLHLGHHFYGAGNLGDDFMLAGFLRGLEHAGATVDLTCSIPFPRNVAAQRHPGIHWLPCDLAARREAIAACHAWLGLGGSPFQSAHSRWFLDHLIADAQLCRELRKPMYFLGIGTQTEAELRQPDVHELCQQARTIWTRDAVSAARIESLEGVAPVHAGADLAHAFFATHAPPRAAPGRVTLVANFDYGPWPGREACLAALDTLAPAKRVWLAQESRELPGAELALFADLPEKEQSRWRLVRPEIPGAPLTDVLARWPSGEWLLTSRFHAAIAGAWAGSKVVVIGINEKLRSIAHDLGAPLIAPDADAAGVLAALRSARPLTPPSHLAERALTASAAFVRSAVAPQG